MAEHSTETANRLAGESSPYLLLHAHNPVDWYPWGPEALEKARSEDKPIFLSVGYSTCYWCHVMERESFSNPETAALMNRSFVNIKLDREERPDVDEIYMAATQILSGHGGWPNSLFLTPDLKPYYAGTYFPPEDRYGRPGFRSVLQSMADAWASRRAEVHEQAEEMGHAMHHFLEERAQPAAVPPHPGSSIHSVDALAKRFDRRFGGFGDAPKFPTPSNLLLLLDLASERPDAGEMLAATLDAMARGGIYDQLGGGFHRYSTDREWKVPHFEKMLYDNGFLLEIYAREHARTGSPEAARIVRQTAEFLGREMTSPEGAFLSAIDAETHGDEGAFYVWNRGEIDAVLGAEDATFLAPLLGFAGPPFFEGERYVLHLPETLAAAAEKRKLDPAELLAEVTALEGRLFAARSRRERPATDDKVLADWNGTAITGMAVAGELLGEPEYVERAARAADFLLSRLRPAGGPLLHAFRAGQAKVPAMLADYVFLVRGLLALHRATPEASESARWLAAAVELTEEQIARLGDGSEDGGGFFAAGESPDLLFRSKDIFDGAMPAGNAVAAWNLVELWERTGDERWIAEARRTLAAFAPLVERAPDAVRTLALASRRYHLAVGGADALAAMSPGGPADERLPEAGMRQLEREEERVVLVRGELGEPASDGFRPFRLTLDIAPGWHINANPASESYLVATEVTAEGVPLREVRYPAPGQMHLAAVDQPLDCYDGTVVVEGEVGAGAGRLLLTYQPCDASRCLPPVTQKLVLA
jgi:uncharacterized protein YyaL (SSP411 family)